MISVLAIVTAKPGMLPAFLHEIHANIPLVRAEKGCIEYGPTVDAKDGPAAQTKLGPDTYVMIEKWETMDDLKAHLNAPHMLTYREKTKDMVASRAVHVLSAA